MWTSIIIILSAIFIISGCKYHSEDAGAVRHDYPAQAETPEELNLTPQFQMVLRKEMIEIESAMQQLLPLIIKGRSESTAQLAKQIHNSFILKSALSNAELKQLVKLLPAHFVKIDRAFHADAAKLAESAGEFDFKKSAQIYGQMVNACVTCHSAYAKNKFPGLK